MGVNIFLSFTEDENEILAIADDITSTLEQIKNISELCKCRNFKLYYFAENIKSFLEKLSSDEKYLSHPRTTITNSLITAKDVTDNGNKHRDDGSLYIQYGLNPFGIDYVNPIKSEATERHIRFDTEKHLVFELISQSKDKQEMIVFKDKASDSSLPDRFYKIPLLGSFDTILNHFRKRWTFTI